MNFQEEIRKQQLLDKINVIRTITPETKETLSEPISKSIFDEFEDDISKGGKTAQVGEVHTWGGKKFKKQPNGKWLEVSEHGMTKDEHEHKYNQAVINFGNYGHDKYQFESGFHARNLQSLSDKEHSDEEVGLGLNQNKEFYGADPTNLSDKELKENK